MSENTLNGALHRMGYANRLTGHGIRATISTALNELGYRKEWIEVQLSHVGPNQVRTAYNHAAYVEQRRQMMQEWRTYWIDGKGARQSTLRLPFIHILTSRLADKEANSWMTNIAANITIEIFQPPVRW